MKTNVLDHGFVRLVDHMGSDLSVARAARVSYDADWRAGEDKGSDERLIRYLWRNHHTSPFEAATFTFEVKAPIFVLRQWHRHRTWCLSGDTLITFERPDRLRKGIRTGVKVRLDDLSRRWNEDQPVKRLDKQKRSLRESRRCRIRAMNLRVYDEKTKAFTVGRICDVIESGVKQVFEITLADGKTLKCSKDHKLLTTEGWQRLEDAIGLVVNGETAGMTRHALVLTNGYIDGHVPWNKGVTGYKTKRVFTDDQKAVLRHHRAGEKSNFWRGGTSTERQKIAGWTTREASKVHAKFDYTCQACGVRGGRLHAHHKKPVVSHPELAFDINNLVTLCDRCHAIEHGRTGESHRAKGITLRAIPSQIVSVRLVGAEPTYDISISGDNHNFVANGIVVHNSYNEVSARYTELPDEFYVPDPDVIGVQSANNKQARDMGGKRDPTYNQISTDMIAYQCRMAFEQYGWLLARGVPRELARTVLPLATYSRMFATVNLLNLLKFITLRSHAHAQWEIQQYSNVMLELIRPHVPVSVAAWEDGNATKEAAKAA